MQQVESVDALTALRTGVRKWALVRHLVYEAGEGEPNRGDFRLSIHSPPLSHLRFAHMALRSLGSRSPQCLSSRGMENWVHNQEICLYLEKLPRTGL